MPGTVQIILVLGACAGLSAALSFCLSRWSRRLHLVAKPRPDRWHREPTPNTGGLGILMACACGGLLWMPRAYGTLAACAACVALLGFVDDRLELRPLVKFAGQSVVAIVLIGSGVEAHLTTSTWANLCISFLWLVGITNAFNLIDNMDGLCAGVAILAGTSEATLALLQHDPARAMLLMVLAAACAGFLIFNYRPARIFLGDCGSLFIGFTLASLAVAGPTRPAHQSAFQAFAALPAFFYPIFDTTLVSVTRRRAGRPISEGGRDHSSHRLVAMGLRECGAVWILWGCAALCGVPGPIAYHSLAWFSAATAALVVAMLIFATFLTRLPGFATAPSRAMLKSQVPGMISREEAGAHTFSLFLQRAGPSRQG